MCVCVNKSNKQTRVVPNRKAVLMQINVHNSGEAGMSEYDLTRQHTSNNRIVKNISLFLLFLEKEVNGATARNFFNEVLKRIVSVYDGSPSAHLHAVAGL